MCDLALAIVLAGMGVLTGAMVLVLTIVVYRAEKEYQRAMRALIEDARTITGSGEDKP